MNNKIKISFAGAVFDLETDSNFVQIQDVIIRFNSQPVEPPKKYKVTFVTVENLVKDGYSVKIANIKAVKVLKDCGLKQAKELVESSYPVVFATKQQVDTIKDIPGVTYNLELQ
jgi:ribosomal protein L7/L12